MGGNNSCSPPGGATHVQMVELEHKQTRVFRGRRAEGLAPPCGSWRTLKRHVEIESFTRASCVKCAIKTRITVCCDTGSTAGLSELLFHSNKSSVFGCVCVRTSSASYLSCDLDADLVQHLVDDALGFFLVLRFIKDLV